MDEILGVTDFVDVNEVDGIFQQPRKPSVSSIKVITILSFICTILTCKDFFHLTFTFREA